MPAILAIHHNEQAATALASFGDGAGFDERSSSDYADALMRLNNGEKFDIILLEPVSYEMGLNYRLSREHKANPQIEQQAAADKGQILEILNLARRINCPVILTSSLAVSETDTYEGLAPYYDLNTLRSLTKQSLPLGCTSKPTYEIVGTALRELSSAIAASSRFTAPNPHQPASR